MKKVNSLDDLIKKIEPIAFVMKRNFSRYMTKLGAHVINIVNFCAREVLRLIKRAGRYLLRKTEPKRIEFSDIIKNRKTLADRRLTDFKRGFKALNESVKSAKEKHGFFGAVKFLAVSSSRTVWRSRGKAVSVFNWVAPALSIAFLVGVVSYASALDYGVSVECNGQTLGLISQESIYDDAERALQERITYVEGNETVTLSPRFSVKMVKNAEEIVNPNQLVDKMIVNSDTELSEAYGLYIDGKFIGALTEPNKSTVMSVFASILNKYSAPDVKTINFEKSIDYRQGLYLKSSLISSSDVIKLVNQKTQTEKTYTIQKGDTPIIIASKNNMSLDELKVLNPNIESSCVIGKQVYLSQEEPYMSVKVTKDLEYAESIDYETVKVEDSKEYKGNNKILVEGKEGEAHVKAEVEYVNGYEVGRTIINRTVTKEPVTKKISVGTKIAAPTRSTVITGTGKYAWPVAGGYISAYQGDGRGHKGIDIAAPKGTSIFAAEAGTVILSKWYSGYGNCIMIQHDDGNVTLYGHQSKLIAQYGQRVEKGELIGLVGNTGNSYGNHCHFEVRRNGKFVNPVDFVK